MLAAQSGPPQDVARCEYISCAWILVGKFLEGTTNPHPDYYKLIPSAVGYSRACMILPTSICWLTKAVLLQASRYRRGKELQRGRRTSPVACIKPARPIPVFCPGTPAQPAELMAALTTGHVHASLVLFDGSLALGTWLGICNDPG